MGHMGDGVQETIGYRRYRVQEYMVQGVWGTGGMGHMGNGGNGAHRQWGTGVWVHGQWGTWTMGHMSCGCTRGT